MHDYANPFLPVCAFASLCLSLTYTQPHAPGSIGDKLNSAFNTASPEAAATAIVTAGRNGRSSASATAAASAIVEQFGKGGRSDAVAEAFAISSARDTAATAAVIAKAAASAFSRGYVPDFARGCVSFGIAFWQTAAARSNESLAHQCDCSINLQ